MAGCYGNDQEDQARERELNRYLDKTYGDDQPEQDQGDKDDAAYERMKERRFEDV